MKQKMGGWESMKLKGWLFENIDKINLQFDSLMMFTVLKVEVRNFCVLDICFW